MLKPGGQYASVSLAKAASQPINWSTASWFSIALGVNTTFSFAIVTVGQKITLILTQDRTGSRTGTFPQRLHLRRRLQDLEHCRQRCRYRADQVRCARCLSLQSLQSVRVAVSGQ